MRKLGIHDLVAMVKYAIKIGIINPETLPFQKDFQIPQYCAICTAANRHCPEIRLILLKI